MKVKEIMTKDMIIISPQDTLEDASSIMRNYDIGFLPVVEEDDVVGVITDRDIVIRAIALGKNSKDSVEPYMTTYLICVDKETTLEDALERMAEEKVKRLLVEEKEKIIGLLSLSDILEKRKDDTYTLEMIEKIFQPVEEISMTDEIAIKEAEVDEFEL